MALQDDAHSRLQERGRNGGHIRLDMIKRVDSPLAFDNGILLESARRRESIEEVQRHANPRDSTSPSEEPASDAENPKPELYHHCVPSTNSVQPSYFLAHTDRTECNSTLRTRPCATAPTTQGELRVPI